MTTGVNENLTGKAAVTKGTREYCISSTLMLLNVLHFILLLTAWVVCSFALSFVLNAL